MAVVVHRAERLVDLDELAVRQALDDAGLDAVLQHLAVAALQADADPVGHEVRDRRRTSMPIRPVHVVRFNEMSNLYAKMSLPPMSSRTMKYVIAIQPSAVRTGTSRGRCSRLWCA